MSLSGCWGKKTASKNRGLLVGLMRTHRVTAMNDNHLMGPEFTVCFYTDLIILFPVSHYNCSIASLLRAIISVQDKALRSIW